ncbi:MAG: hypothetical protein ACP5QZ_05360 [Candidatus Sumerlaeaceae bacterium]
MEKEQNTHTLPPKGTAFSPDEHLRSSVQSFARKYARVSLFCFNLLIAAIVLNILAWVVLITRPTRPHVSWNPIVDRYGPEAAEKAFRLVYENMPRNEVDKLLTETWGRPVAFHPFTLFRERPYRGQYVNIDEWGFRYSKDQEPWPPSRKNINIFIFGGSTTFGYGVADWQTVPSAIQDSLRRTFPTQRIVVYNFGTNSFYSSQERAYLQFLLSEGYVPDVAVFIDGLNEFFYIDNVPKYSSQLSEMLDIIVAEKPPPSPWAAAAKQLPLIRLLQLMGKKEHGFAVADGDDPNALTQADVAYFNRPEVIGKVISTYLANKRMIEGAGEQFRFSTLFVWQPVPSYHFDLRRHLFPKDCKKMFSAFGYPKMRQLYEEGKLGQNFLWAADLQTTAPDPVYLDMVHYSPQFSRLLGETIANALGPRIKEMSQHRITHESASPQ